MGKYVQVCSSQIRAYADTHLCLLTRGDDDDVAGRDCGRPLYLNSSCDRCIV
jgi:hypothetical protein